jgi:import inner membrane translocase subunit TIM44
LKKNYEESDNLFIQYTRAFTERVSDTLSSIFSESDNAIAIAHFKQTIDPNFNLDVFMRQAREFIIPEVIDAYLHGDVDTLRLWCSEATFNVLTAGIKAQLQQGLVSDSKILDLRNVEVSKLYYNLNISD